MFQAEQNKFQFTNVIRGILFDSARFGVLQNADTQQEFF